MTNGMVLGLAAMLAVAPAAPPPTPAEAGFARLKTLVGAWRRTGPGSALGVTYRLTAGGTVLVETWAPGTPRESMTLYHLDGVALLATHYCPQGNQPRLRLAGTATDRLTFAFRDATNLKPGASHQHGLSLHLQGPDRLRRDEVYRTGATDEADTVTFERVGVATPPE